MIVTAKQQKKPSEKVLTSTLSFSAKTEAEVCYYKNMADAYNNSTDFELVQMFNSDGLLIQMDYKD